MAALSEPGRMVVGGREHRALILRRGAETAQLLPDLGGRIGAWWVETPDGPWHRLEPLPAEGPADLALRRGGCYPLVPYSNRIENGRFRWDGREIALTPSPIAAPHSLHGVGWQRPWRVEETAEDAAMLCLDHDGDADWPFAFRARMTVALTDGGMALALRVENRSDGPQPVGLGFHPFFPARAEALMSFTAEHHWCTRPDLIPTGRAAVPPTLDFTRPRRPQDGLDDVFGGWTGTATLAWPAAGRSLTLEAGPEMDHLVLFTPPGRPFVCVEPVSHPTNAVNRPDAAMRVLAPGQEWGSRLILSPGT